MLMTGRVSDWSNHDGIVLFVFLIIDWMRTETTGVQH